ncbi:MAG: alpha/beta hydrolase, partial [Planctomycetota bacterium]|nr:alpha/beta hydrolase [Planctomycetota bacterium]
YVAAFKRSSFEGMLNYYKANYPKPMSKPAKHGDALTYPQVKCPVLVFHGLKDQAVLASGLNGNWDWVDNEFTLVTIPGAGHFVHHDASELVTQKIAGWLNEILK